MKIYEHFLIFKKCEKSMTVAHFKFLKKYFEKL